LIGASAAQAIEDRAVESLVEGMDRLMRLATCHTWSRQDALAAAAERTLAEAVHVAQSGVTYCCIALKHSLPISMQVMTAHVSTYCDGKVIGRRHVFAVIHAFKHALPVSE
jgi:hypothetical protein